MPWGKESDGMKDLLNAAEMKAVDQRSIEEYGIPSLVLMERAALRW